MICSSLTEVLKEVLPVPELVFLLPLVAVCCLNMFCRADWVLFWVSFVVLNEVRCSDTDCLRRRLDVSFGGHGILLISDYM